MIETDLYMEIIQRLTIIETKLDGFTETKNDVDVLKQKVIELQARDDAQQKELFEIKEESKWLKRAVVGAIITAVLTLMVYLLKFALIGQ